MDTIRERVFSQGFTSDQLDACISEYESLHVLQVVDNGRVLSVVSSKERKKEKKENRAHIKGIPFKLVLVLYFVLLFFCIMFILSSSI